jgi:hypothetical protein
VAGSFDGNAANGDEVALLANNVWYFDRNHNFRIDAAEVAGAFSGSLTGLPIVGDFDGDGFDDLGTWKEDTFTFLLTAGVNVWAVGGVPTVPDSIDFGFIGTREKPVAADMDQDGIDDIGLWVPDRAGVAPEEQGEWYFLISDDRAGTARVDGTVVTLDHPFKPVPFGNERAEGGARVQGDSRRLLDGGSRRVDHGGSRDADRSGRSRVGQRGIRSPRGRREQCLGVAERHRPVLCGIPGVGPYAACVPRRSRPES